MLPAHYAIHRSRIRKVLGAEKHSLVTQFIGESVVLSFIALLLGVGISWFVLSFFSYMSGTALSLHISTHWMFILAFVGIAIVTGVLAGSYPAFYLSSFIPVKVLKGRFTNSLSAVSLRKGLVVFQFIISVVLIIASVVINRQMQYMRNKDLDFQKDQQIVIPMRSNNAKGSIVGLLSKDFIKLVLIALFIAAPIGWYFSNKWLQEFAYRVDVSWWMFATAGIFALVIAFATISFHAVIAAMTNPTTNLRTE